MADKREGGFARMANKIKSLGHEMQRVIDLGLIDHWLRGLSQIAPRPVSRTAEDYADDFNTHLIGYDSVDSIDAAHIQNLTGCRQLLATCSKNNIFVDLKMSNDGHLSVTFQPELEFKHSTVFGASYHNVLPTLFTRPARQPEYTG